VSPTQNEMRERIRKILYSYPEGIPLAAGDREFMLGILGNHPTAEAKIGCGVASIVVRINPVFRQQRGFWVVRKDGSETDFSFEKCLRHPAPEQRLKAAARVAVAPSVIRFKRDFFNAYPVAFCPVTGEPLGPGDCHIDHAPPMTFEAILARFLEESGLTSEQIKVSGPGQDGRIGCEIEDPEIRGKFILFHDRVASLRVVSKRANLSDVKKTVGGLASKGGRLDRSPAHLSQSRCGKHEPIQG
jgi:hypothetical protein